MRARLPIVVAGGVVAALVVGGAGVAVAVGAGDGDRLSTSDRERAESVALDAVGGGTVVDSEADDGGFEVEVRRADGTEVDVVLDGNFTVVFTDVDGPDGAGGDDDDRALTADEVERADEAALAATGGGTVIDREVDDGGYEVDVRQDDGAVVEVHLDATFTVIGQDRDGPGED